MGAAYTSDIENPLEGTPEKVETKKLNFNVTDQAHRDLAALARLTGRSMTEIIRLGIALARIVLEGQRCGQHFVVTDNQGKALKELVLP